MADGPNGLEECVGSAYLFVESSLDEMTLSDAYSQPQQKVAVYHALRTALTEHGGSPERLQILKIHRSDPQLAVQVRFRGRPACRRFLRAYREGALRATLQKRLAVPLQLELRAGAERLDAALADEERCVSCVFAHKPDRLRDEELTELEAALRGLWSEPSSSGPGAAPAPAPESEPSPSPAPESKSAPEPSPAPESKSAPEPSPAPSEQPPPPGQTFLFRGQPVADRPLSLRDQQTFARAAGLQWRRVGRSLQRGCRALRDPALDALAYEYERDGLYEQAFQLLRRFVQAEGRRATLRRLVEALEENELAGLAEDLLGLAGPDGGAD